MVANVHLEPSGEIDEGLSGPSAICARRRPGEALVAAGDWNFLPQFAAAPPRAADSELHSDRRALPESFAGGASLEIHLPQDMVGAPDCENLEYLEAPVSRVQVHQSPSLLDDVLAPSWAAPTVSVDWRYAPADHAWIVCDTVLSADRLPQQRRQWRPRDTEVAMQDLRERFRTQSPPRDAAA